MTKTRDRSRLVDEKGSEITVRGDGGDRPRARDVLMSADADHDGPGER